MGLARGERHSWILRPGMALLCLSLLSAAGAAVLSEDFAVDPLTNGWSIFGDASLFQWQADTGTMRVTWDSSRTNSILYRTLPASLNRGDDFSFSFELRLDDIQAGVRPEKPGPFEIAIGLLNTGSVTNGGFVRGTVSKFPNLCEFDYFPQGSNPPPVGVIAPTVSPMLCSSNGQPATSMNFPMELSPNNDYRIEVGFTASNQTLTASILRNGTAYGSIKKVTFPGSFADFRLDAFSVSSYSDTGDRYGSVLAHGEIDNVIMTTPDAPRPVLWGMLVGGHWQVRFESRTNWLYRLESGADLSAWSAVSEWLPGTGSRLSLDDTNQAPLPAAFYRVRLQKK